MRIRLIPSTLAMLATLATLVMLSSTAASAAVTCTVEAGPPPRFLCRAVTPAVPGATSNFHDGLPLEWSREQVTGGPIPGGAGTPCQRQVDPPPGIPAPPPGSPVVYTEFGVPWYVEVINMDTLAIVASDAFCEYPPDNPPEPPPPPPSLPQIIEKMEEALKVPTQTNPSTGIGGLTGLDTWLWCEDPGTVGPTVESNGWKGEVTANVSKLDWAMNGPSAADRSAPSCGSEAAPAATWMPETMGGHTVTLTATYSGSWTLSGEIDLGLCCGDAGTVPVAPQTFALPDVLVPGDPVPYAVDEQVGVLTG